MLTSSAALRLLTVDRPPPDVIRLAATGRALRMLEEIWRRSPLSGASFLGR
jgi:hypothetical protein